jgi:rhamnogalacturonan endolyase
MRRFFLMTACLMLCAQAVSVFSNIPGGGDGTGPNVTLANNGDGTLTMANGIVTAKIKISTAQVLQFTYNGFPVTDGGTASNNGFYWQGNSGSSDTLTTIVNPSTNGGNFTVIQLYDSYTNSGAGADAYRYFAMFRGSPGLYVCEVMAHTSAMPSGGVDTPSLTCKLGSDIFNWLAQDTGRNQLMQRVSDTAIGGVNNAPKEVTLLTSGQLAGRFDCKYDFSGDLGCLGFSGWCSTNQTTNFGLWMIHPSNEYLTAGPMHREILAQMMLINSTFKGVHFGFHDDFNMAAGEVWSKVNGPFFLYFNKVASGISHPEAALYSDAVAQTAAERGAWPYSWLTNTNYVTASGRGMVQGKISISDSGNPNASAANLWVGLAQQPSTPTSPTPTDFQLWGKNYQYWTHSDADGNFSISNVIAGSNYTLFAFGPGAIGQFQSQPLSGAAATVTIATPASPFSVAVIAGQTNDLGNVTWTPSRMGATVWEIGMPDRDTTEFRHGADYWHGDIGSATNLPSNWAPWQDFSLDFPTGLTYTVGQSHWDKDWDYAQGCVLDPATGNLNPNMWAISFNLPDAPTNGAQASIYFGIAADYSGPIIVQVNGNNIAGSTGFFPYYSDSGSANDAMIRMGSHGIFSDWRINFASSLLHQGQNTITLTMRKGGYFSNDAMYDYVRLELAGYVPPAPANLYASAGNGLVSLFWPSASGATGYDVLRSTSSGGGYLPIATNVIGPVCGSVDDTSAFIDTNVVNGTTYYYVVRSANPTGSSPNSIQVSATPSVATSGTPVAPINVTATAGNNSMTLKWNASSGAARYIIQRTVLTIGAVTTYTSGGINPYSVINSYVTGTNYTDTALANNVTYSYLVSAANANGQSAASAAVSTIPTPPIPSIPGGLAASVVSNQVTLSWSMDSDASSYIVQRATSTAGFYSTVDNPEPLTFFIDAGLNYNSTYYYRVASASLGGISGNSAPVAVTTTPAPPSPLTAIPGNAQVFVDWGDSPGATNYVLQRSTVSGGPYTTIVSTTNTSYLNTGVVNGTTYYYVVYAVGTNGASPLSVQATATPSATPQMIKSDTTNMNTSADWSGVAPDIGEVGLFNNIISAANEAALNLGGDVTIGGLVFTNNLNGSVNVAAGNTLTLGSSGIDMSKANQNVAFNNTIALAALQIWNITNSRTLTVSGTLTSASNTVIKTGGGTLALGITSSDAGANVQVNSGVVQANASSGIMISLNGGTFSVNAFDSNPIHIMSGGTEQNVGGNRTWNGNLTGSGPLAVIASSTHTWSGDNSGYTGTITLLGSGTLRLSAINAVSATTAYNFGGGTMSANASGLFNLGSLSGSGTLNTGSGENFSIGALAVDTTFSGAIAGAGYIVKDGVGTLTLSGASTYTGGTIINDGTLVAANTSGSGTGFGAVTVNAGGTLGGNGIISGAATVNSGGTLAPGNPFGALTFSNSLTLAAGSTNIFEINSSPLANAVAKIFGALTNGGTVVVTNVGSAELSSGQSFRLFDAGSYHGNFANVILPPLPAGLAWDTNLLRTNGTLSIVISAKPVINGISISESGLIFSGVGGAANASYYLLGAANLMTPLSNWTRLLTNQFDVNGNFIFTNSPGADEQQFYLLQIP